MHLQQVTTPLLILHGAADERVPTYQGQEYFEVLAARGKTTRMVTYPGSPHFPTVWEQRRTSFVKLQLGWRNTTRRNKGRRNIQTLGTLPACQPQSSHSQAGFLAGN
jgi:acetyl esterase/lipase